MIPMRKTNHIWFLLILILPGDHYVEKLLQEKITIRHCLQPVPEEEECNFTHSN